MYMFLKFGLLLYLAHSVTTAATIVSTTFNHEYKDLIEKTSMPKGPSNHFRTLEATFRNTTENGKSLRVAVSATNSMEESNRTTDDPMDSGNHTTFPRTRQSRKEISKPDASALPVNVINIPVPGKPVLAVKPPVTFEIETPGKPIVEFVATPDIQLELTPVSKPIPIPSLPEIGISEGQSSLFQIPLLPHISFAKPFGYLFGNYTVLEGWKPWKPLTGLSIGWEDDLPKPLYSRIKNLIKKILGKVTEVSGVGSIFPNSTTIQANRDKFISVLKVLMMDSPF